MTYCQVCGNLDEIYDEDSETTHNATPKHIYNKILKVYGGEKQLFKRNRDGIEVFTSVVGTDIEKSDIFKINVNAKPNEIVRYDFTINNVSNQDVIVVGIGLAHPQPQFALNDNGMQFGCSRPYLLKGKSSVPKKVYVTFKVSDIGQYEMPVMFTFQKIESKKNLIIVREMIVNVDYEHIYTPPLKKNPYTSDNWERANVFHPCLTHMAISDTFSVPKPLKTLFAVGLEEHSLDNVKGTIEKKRELGSILKQTRDILRDGLIKHNYISYWHHLLWWEEVTVTLNLKKYNMGKVTLVNRDPAYLLEVPGLAERRPSLLRGDKVYVRPVDKNDTIFESVIRVIDHNVIHLSGFDKSFHAYHSETSTFNIRFIMSRVPMERMHHAVTRIYCSEQSCRVFPEPNAAVPPLTIIKKFHNEKINDNPEQAMAVRHIVSGSSGKTPYMVFGPPGTGKTITIVEAILQLVLTNSKNRILVCTDSNMAADHIACTIYQYKALFQQKKIINFLYRACSQNRVWEGFPPSLEPIANGKSFITWSPVCNEFLSKFRIVVTTLQHSAKYGMIQTPAAPMTITHLFIDEAGQSMEPTCLIPITGLLAPKGKLILAGDTKQLGPVCISKHARKWGLGISLMERLKMQYENLYDNNPNYITMLKKNFRSHPDILQIPNNLFYDNSLEPSAPLDPLSTTKILTDEEGGEGAVVFHGVNSVEQRIGKSPSYFNEKELSLLKRYVKALVDQHHVEKSDIGVIAPYVRQVYRIKQWLNGEGYKAIDVGTVEAFQGKEKRVILVSTVRANCRLLDFDAKYGLGFLVDDKRFNVTLTRAKAKVIIIGNPACLLRDVKWRKYMDLCKSLNSYLGHESEQLPRTTEMLKEIAGIRFDYCRLSEHLSEASKIQEKLSNEEKQT